MSKKSRHYIAKSIGKGLAYIQDTVDVAVGWGFYKLKSTKIDDTNDDPKTSKAKQVANNVMGFFGELGDSFYSEYERIKHERNQKTPKK